VDLGYTKKYIKIIKSMSYVEKFNREFIKLLIISICCYDFFDGGNFRKIPDFEKKVGDFPK
jgi:hypothetical protein